LAATYGYLNILRAGLVGTLIGIVLMIVTAMTDIRLMVLIVSLIVGVTYAGCANIILNGLGIVLSPKDNPGFLPGLNAGAFNLGAGVSFAVLYAVKKAFSPANPASHVGYTASMIAGLVLIALALAMSMLIPRPVEAEEAGADAGAKR
jgi:hypothetical protein